LGDSGRLVSTGDNGNTVYQMVANYQEPTYPSGDTGYMRLLEMDPVQNTVSVQTYSPYYDPTYTNYGPPTASPSPGPTHLTDPGNQFVFSNVYLGAVDYTAPTVPIGVNATPVSGSQIDLAWTPSTDTESWVSYYNVYRDGTFVGTTTGTSYSDTSLAGSTTYSYEIAAVNPDGTESAKSAPVNATTQAGASVRGYWALDDGSGTTATDSSGNGHHGTLVNGPVWTTGRVDAGLLFDGNNDYVDVPYQALNGLTDVSSAFWLKSTDTGSQAVFSGVNAGFDNEYLVFFNDPTTLWLYAQFAGNIASWTVPTVADGQWRHYAIAADSTSDTAELYLDGASQGTRALTIDVPFDIDPGGFVLGQEQDSVGGGFDPTQALNGTLDELYIFDRVLSAQDVQTLYTVGPVAPGDFDQDGDVDDDDNSAWQTGFGTLVGATLADGDSDDDGDVDGGDFLNWQINYGTGVPTGQGAGSLDTPEPVAVTSGDDEGPESGLLRWQVNFGAGVSSGSIAGGRSYQPATTPLAVGDVLGQRRRAFPLDQKAVVDEVHSKWVRDRPLAYHGEFSERQARTADSLLSSDKLASAREIAILEHRRDAYRPLRGRAALRADLLSIEGRDRDDALASYLRDGGVHRS